MSIEKFEEKILKTTSSTTAISRQPIPIRCLATFSVKTRILMEECRLRILYMRNLASTILQHLLQCQLEVVPVPGEQLISKEKRLLKHLKQSHKPFSIF